MTTAPRKPAPGLYGSAEAVSLLGPELADPAIALVKGIGISVYLSP
ncbi:hypothetical protein [Streptomyces sp. NBC_01092]|nr:hypothetical protein OG254_47885 [Streptomyces sp. NBC_01092]